ncbi:hypothetical protein N7495_006783 [Penicillium taxi]|uniref:uncharacterized protein n=1 Tax=Penicillium taxi TaxID=168475 RepID=UPI0025455F7C|nr:uncharacterized protein N7495_006783 [Penicillium taxi]KAJ5895092.1 hypothetical protein N7495_006783 [Penicillium taxi]
MEPKIIKEEWVKMLHEEPYDPMNEKLVANRARCKKACEDFNIAGQVTRRRKVELWREILGIKTKKDAALFDETYPFVEGPIFVINGLNLKVGAGTRLGLNMVIEDASPIKIGQRVSIEPNVSLFGEIRPLDPAMRQGPNRLVAGRGIYIGDDVFIAGGATILGGVTIGKGSMVGTGSVVGGDVPPFHFVAGNLATFMKKIPTQMDSEYGNDQGGGKKKKPKQGSTKDPKQGNEADDRGGRKDKHQGQGQRKREGKRAERAQGTMFGE